MRIQMLTLCIRTEAPVQLFNVATHRQNGHLSTATNFNVPFNHRMERRHKITDNDIALAESRAKRYLDNRDAGTLAD